LNVEKPKVLQLRGALPSDPLTIGSSAPGPRWGLQPPDSHYRAGHGMGPCPSPRCCGLEPHCLGLYFW